MSPYCSDYVITLIENVGRSCQDYCWYTHPLVVERSIIYQVPMMASLQIVSKRCSCNSPDLL